MLAYELLVGCPPFYEQSRDRIEARIKTARPNFPRTMGDDARGFITAALCKDPAARPTVLQLLQHPWVNTFRVRRSMRQLPTQGLAAPRGAGVGGAAEAPVSGAALPAAAVCAKPSAGAAAVAAAAAAARPSSRCAAAEGAPAESPRTQQAAAAARKRVAVLLPQEETSPLASASPSPRSQPATAGSAASSPRRLGAASPTSPSTKAVIPSLAAIESGISGSHRPLKLSSSLAVKRAPNGAATAAAAASGSSTGARLGLSSAKSSPLLYAGDLRDLGLKGVGAAVPLEGAGDAATGEAQRKKWLNSIRLWPGNQPGGGR